VPALRPCSISSRHPEIDSQAAKAAKRHIERVVAGTFPLERGEPKALKELLRRTRATFAWAEEQGVSWPPVGPEEAVA
jgi:hypothetical protein